MTKKLFDSFSLGTLELRNRVVMAPMTRCRADAAHVPTDLMVEYYTQRAGAGLIITEGTSPSPNGLGYARIPGLFDPSHVTAWSRITGAVHAKGGAIFVQLMHTGRVSHPLNMPAGTRILAPSAATLAGEMWTDQEGMQSYPEPIAMTEADIHTAIEEYARSAELALEAGFDGVELHGANGYLIDQFLNTAANQRTDAWGGSIENRARFALEVAKATVARIGAARTAIRLSPYGVFNGMQPDAHTDALYEHLARGLSGLGLAYIHVVDHSALGAPEVPAAIKRVLRETFTGAYVLSGGYDVARAEADLVEAEGDLVAFGRPFIANPDLVSRFEQSLELAVPDPTTFYTPGPEGYTSYAVGAEAAS